MEKLFVYGTLQRGYALNHCLVQAGAEFLSPAVTVPHFCMLRGGYTDYIHRFPVVLDRDEEPGAPVAGELYAVPKHFQWQRFDDIECAYNRRLIRVLQHWPETPEEVSAYIYIGKPKTWGYPAHQRKALTPAHTDGLLYWVIPEEVAR